MKCQKGGTIDIPIYIQDESAGLAVKLLNPKTKMRLLDMAAAPSIGAFLRAR